jgi:hypothetical protein
MAILWAAAVVAAAGPSLLFIRRTPSGVWSRCREYAASRNSSCDTRESSDPVAIPAAGGAPLVQDTVPAQSTATHLEQARSPLRPLAPPSSCCACDAARHHVQGKYAVVPASTGLCAGWLATAIPTATDRRGRAGHCSIAQPPVRPPAADDRLRRAGPRSSAVSSSPRNTPATRQEWHA